MTTHGAIAAHLPDCDDDIVADVWKDYTAANLSDKMKSLLHIAELVCKGGLYVTAADIEEARKMEPMTWTFMTRF
jgi:hypothetical protein